MMKEIQGIDAEGIESSVRHPAVMMVSSLVAKQQQQNQHQQWSRRYGTSAVGALLAAGIDARDSPDEGLGDEREEYETDILD